MGWKHLHQQPWYSDKRPHCAKLEAEKEAELVLQKAVAPGVETLVMTHKRARLGTTSMTKGDASTAENGATWEVAAHNM